jgi:hypothetical protein
MKKRYILTIFCLLLLQIVSADLAIEKSNFKDTMVLDVNETVQITLKLTNNGPGDTFEIYNLLGFSISPNEKIYIDSGQTKTLTLLITRIGDWDYVGAYTFTYFIKGQKSETKDELTFKVSKL